MPAFCNGQSEEAAVTSALIRVTFESMNSRPFCWSALRSPSGLRTSSLTPVDLTSPSRFTCCLISMGGTRMPEPIFSAQSLLITAADAIAAAEPAGKAPVHLMTTYSVTSDLFGSSTTTLFGTCSSRAAPEFFSCDARSSLLLSAWET